MLMLTFHAILRSVLFPLSPPRENAVASCKHPISVFFVAATSSVGVGVKVGGEKAALRQQRLELEDKEAEINKRQESVRILDAKVRTPEVDEHHDG